MRSAEEFPTWCISRCLDAALRKELWESILPKDTPVAGEVDALMLAQAFELSGASIKNGSTAWCIAGSVGRGAGGDEASPGRYRK